jgi:D-3-phosphoglycerate dehydrogenase
MRKKRILIVSTVIDEFIEGLEQEGFECTYKPGLPREEIRSTIHLYEGLIFRSKFRLDREMIDASKKLEFAGRVGSGMENVDLAYAESKGIRLYRSPEGNADAVAEHSVGMLLALLNKFYLADQMVRNMTWDREKARGVRLEEKKVGIIGYGYTGRAVEKLLQCFGVELLIYDPYVDDVDHLVDLQEIYHNADIVSFHIPLYDETHHFFNADFIQAMKRPFYLMNTSRGGVVNTSDLLDGLESKKVLGAALDVFENEDINILSEKDLQAMQRLRVLENVLLSPHVAGWNDYSKRALHDILLKKITDGETGWNQLLT